MLTNSRTYRGLTWLPAVNPSCPDPAKSGENVHPVFADRKTELEVLEGWLQDESNTGPILVTGFRGVGKTSLVNAALAKVAFADWREPVDTGPEAKRRRIHLVVDIAVPRFVSEAALLRRILVRTYMRLVQLAASDCAELRPVVSAAWLAASRAMGSVETTNKDRFSLKAGRSKDGLTAEAEYIRAMELKVSASPSTAEEFEDDFLDMVADIERETSRDGAVQGIGEAARRSVQGMGKALRTLWSGQKPFQLTIVFDELDKITDRHCSPDQTHSGEEIVTELTRQLKTLLCIPNIRFILVGGIDLEFAWLEQKLRPNSLLPSVFPHRLYVPAVPREGAAPGPQAQPPTQEQVAGEGKTETPEKRMQKEVQRLVAALKRLADQDVSGGFVPGRSVPGGPSDDSLQLGQADVDGFTGCLEKVKKLPFLGQGTALSLDLLWLAWHARWLQRRLVEEKAKIEIMQDLVPGDRQWVRDAINGLLDSFP